MDINDNPYFKGALHFAAHKIEGFFEKKQEEARESGEPTLLSCIADCVDESVRQDIEREPSYAEMEKQEKVFHKNAPYEVDHIICPPEDEFYDEAEEISYRIVQ